jgi:hypothetical protein
MMLLSPSLCLASFCPPNEAVTAKLDQFAAHGKATIDNATYQLIGNDSTNIFYQEKLLENDAQLNGFLKVSRVFDRDLPAKAEARHLDLVPTPNFCAYEISLGENKQVIAITKQQ